MPIVSELVTKLFADDTCLVFSAKSLNSLQIAINLEMKKIEKWLTMNKFSLNYSKRKFMLIHKKLSIGNFNLYIDNNKIEQVKLYEYLGVTIDEKLNWIDQIKHIESKLSQACGAIARIRPFVDQECLRTLYFGYAYPFLQYAVLAWGSATKTNLKRIHVLHNRILRLMSLHGPLIDIELSNNELYKNMNLLKFDDIYFLETAKFMYRCTNKSLPDSFESYFVRKEYRFNLRSTVSNPFIKQRANTNAYKRWLINHGLDVWEKIDQKTKNLSYFSFKYEVKTKILKEY